MTMTQDHGTGPGGGEKWSDPGRISQVEGQGQGQDQIRDVREKRASRMNLRLLVWLHGKTDLLLAELRKTAGEQVEVSGARFRACYV